MENQINWIFLNKDEAVTLSASNLKSEFHSQPIRVLYTRNPLKFQLPYVEFST